MDYDRAIRFPTRDPSWVAKIAVGSLIGLVPVLNLAQQGYGVEVIRRVAGGDREEMPAWDQLGRYFSKGFGVAAASFIYLLPGFVLFLLLAILGQVSAVFFALAFVVLVVYVLLAALVFPAAVTRYALTDQWISLFDFPWVQSYIGRNLRGYLLVLLVALLFSVLAGILGGLLLLIGSIVATFWAVMTACHLLGQLAYESQPDSAKLFL